MNKKDLERIQSKLLALDYFEYHDRVYWKSWTDSILFLDKERYWEKRHRLEKYFQDRPPAEQRSLIEENMSIGAKRLEEEIDLSQIKIEETYSGSSGVKCWKISGYNSELDGRDLTPLIEGSKKSLRSENDWDSTSPRNSWLDDYLEAYQRKLRLEMSGVEEDIELKERKKGWRRSIWH